MHACPSTTDPTARAMLDRGVMIHPPRGRGRGDAALRVVAAIPVGYAVAGLWAAALARLLPGDRAEATVAATLVAFAICAGAVMWAYAARSGWRALWTLVVAGIIAGGATWTSVTMTGRL